jgi:glycosyltransferase involved in cell wall biosynthesis
LEGKDVDIVQKVPEYARASQQQDSDSSIFAKHLSDTSYRVSVVIPTLNEEKNLPHVLPLIPDWVNEIILVDGNSIDRTVEVARSINEEIRILLQNGKGKGDALITGFDAAKGDIIVMLDADGSTSPTEIPAFVGTLLAGADFAKGSRFLQGGGTSDMPLHRRLGNFAFVLLVRLLFGGAYTDLCYGYNAFWKKAIRKLNLSADGFEIETQMNVRALIAGLKVVEVPSFETSRLHGIAKLRAFKDGLRVLATIWNEKRRYVVTRLGTREFNVDDLWAVDAAESAEIE